MIEFLNAYNQPIVAAWCAVQALFSLMVVSMVATQSETVPVFLRPFDFLHRMTRLVVGIAWIGVLYGAVLSGSAIILYEASTSVKIEYIARNDLGVFISRTAGAIIIPHAAWLCYRVVKFYYDNGKRVPEADEF